MTSVAFSEVPTCLEAGARGWESLANDALIPTTTANPLVDVRVVRVSLVRQSR